MGSKHWYFRQKDLQNHVHCKRKYNDIALCICKKDTENPERRYGVRKEKKKLGFRRSKMNNAYVGSSFNDFLEEEGIATDVQNEAIKQLISYHLLVPCNI